jgi:hypothetical protein
MAPYCSEEHAMKHLIAISGMVAALVAAPPAALAQASTPPAPPALSEQQSQEVHARIDAYRRATDARVQRGEISADEAARLVAWREWQIAQQMAATTARANAPRDAGVPPDYDGSRDADAPRLRGDYESRPGDYYVVEPPPVYAPYPYYRYPAPYYWGPRPYAYWGPSICAGGFGRHFGGRVCF